MIDRDLLLTMPVDEFCRCCTVSLFKASGPGGQHRNKTFSAVRLQLNGSALSAEDCTERSQLRNKSNAVKKLKMKLALSVRVLPSLPPERIECSLTADDYPLFAARLFDLLWEHDFDYRAVAAVCSISPSALLKKIARDPLLVQEFSKQRAERELPKLNL